jgi:hypothetical protein
LRRNPRRIFASAENKEAASTEGRPKELNNLREQGYLTPGEYEEKRAGILGEL